MSKGAFRKTLSFLAAAAVGTSWLVADVERAAAQTQVVAIPVQNPRADFGKDLDREEVEDLRVKVVGGIVSLRRSRVADKWTFNPRLPDLIASLCLGGPGTIVVSYTTCYAGIRRGEFTYAAVRNSHPPRWEGGRNVIVKTADGMRWEDPEGRWVEYVVLPRDYNSLADKFIATSYGDRNGVIATLRRDSRNRIAGFLDRRGREVLTLQYDGLDQVIRAVDYTGREVLYGYSGRKLISFTDVRSNLWTDEYSGNSLVRRTDPEGRVTTILRSGDLLAGMRDEDGLGVDYRYDYDARADEFYFQERFSGNRIVESWSHTRDGLRRRDLNGRTVLTVRNDGSSRTYTDESGNETRVTFDDRQRVTSVAYADGSSIRIDLLPGLGVPRAITNENGVVTRFEHDTRGNVIRMVEAAGLPEERVTLRQYDADGQLIESREVVDGGSGDRVTTLTYDSYGNIATLTDAEGNTYAMQYDVIGNITRLTDPRGKLWQFRYDPAGNLLETTDPLNARVLYDYDKVGNLVRTTDEENAVTQYVYNRQNNITRIIDALQNEWRYEYTEASLLKRIIDPEGHTREYGYDRDGRLSTYKDGSGNVTSLAYLAGRTQDNPANGPLVRINYPTFVRERQFDPRNRLVVETDVETSGRRLTARWSYDGLGNVKSVVTPDLRQSAYGYDALNRLVRQTQTDGSAVQLAWDGWGQTLQVTDPRQQATVLRYDKLGQLVSERQPSGALTRYTYDSTGNVLSVIDPRDQEVRYDYDDFGQLRYERTYPVVGGTAPSRSIQYAYDLRGILTSYIDGTVSGTYTPDPLGRITNAAVNFGPFTKGVQYGYYRNGLLQTYTAPDGVTYGYTYDGNDQLQSVAIPSQGTLTVSARHWLAPSRITLPGGVAREFEYDDRLLPKRITSRDGAGNVILDYQYMRDDADLIREIATEHGTHHYEYDDAYRLTSADHPVLGLEAFRYDAAGNRFPANPALAGQWSYGNNNELRTTDTESYDYDAAGNLTQRVGASGDTRFAYDEQSRLRRVETGAGSPIGEYAYDPFGRRLWKEVGGSRTYFYYTPEGIAAELDASGSVIRSYGFEPGTSWTTAPLFLRANGNYSYYHNDHLGTPRKLTTAAGAVAWSAVHSSFGAAQLEVEVVLNPLRFPGQYFDAETGLHQNFFRDYNPMAGRYVEPDPIGLYAGLNRYTYANSNPLSLTDDKGLILPAVGAALVVGFEVYGIYQCASDLSKLGDPCARDLTSTALGCGGAAVGLGSALRSFRALGSSLRQLRTVTREVRLLNAPIKITPEGLRHVQERHTFNEIAKFANKSKFNPTENVEELIRSGTQQRMLQQANGNFARTFDVGRNIGVDRATSQQTSIITVITGPGGDLVTAFPGRP